VIALGSSSLARDTDQDWRVIAETEPFFGVLANERFLSGNLTPVAVEEFYETGRADIAHVVDTLTDVSRSRFAPDTALDFGCGVGRLSFPMASYARRVIGVDVADDMLRVAREQAEARHVAAVEFRSTLPDENVDWINSLIVFQHIPPERGYDILGELVDRLAPHGFVSVQMTVFRDRRHTAEIIRDLADHTFDGRTIELLGGPEKASLGSMSMYDYDMNRVLRILFMGGITSVVAEHTNHGGCHGAWVFGQRRS